MGNPKLYPNHYHLQCPKGYHHQSLNPLHPIIMETLSLSSIVQNHIILERINRLTNKLRSALDQGAYHEASHIENTINHISNKLQS